MLLPPDHLRPILETAHNARRVRPSDLLALAMALPPGLGLTIDLQARAAVGCPVLVLRPAAVDLPRLSPREREVAGLVAAGLSNAQIAARLHLTLGTVKDHVHHVLQKTGLPSRVAIAAAWASSSATRGTRG